MLFFFNDTATTEIYTLSLHDALPIYDHKYDAIPTRDYYRMLKVFNGGDRDLVPLAPLEQAQRYRAAQTNWQAEFNSATNRFEKWMATAIKPYESAAKQAKIKALEVSDAEKAALLDEPDGKAAKELAKKFSKELKIERKDYRQFVSEDERAEWDRLEKDVKDVEKRKPKPLPSALAFADYGPEPRETWLFNRGDFH